MKGVLIGLLMATFLWFGSVQAEPPRLDLNTADVETLATALHGVGRERAAAIVAYREEHGPFQSVEDLTKVRGIGAATVERNRAVLYVAPKE
ncbi:helix-hairpin-helix domain-containing protein [Ectothiorhodospiraceae bacterium 2226]|nr:helix-hairpin-helix domain-containing protein [Ectothiorhodospiraceae bacterium 2226]